MHIFMFLLVSVAAVFIEVPALRIRKLKKELWAFFIFMALSIILYFIQVTRGHIPSPLIGMEYAFKPLSELINKWLS